MSTQKRRRPRALTLTLPNAAQPYFLLQGQRYTLRNFNQEGIGLWFPPPVPFGLAPGSQISGDVVLGEEIFTVKLEIKHASNGVMGLRFVQIAPELSTIIKRLMEPSTYGAELKLHARSGEEDPGEGFPRLWYVGDSGTELVLWYNNLSRMIQALQVCWQGKWAYRRQFEVAETGFLKDGITLEGYRIGKRELLQEDKTPNPLLLHEAAQFLTSVPPPLPGHLLWQFLELGEQVFLPEDYFSKSKVA